MSIINETVLSPGDSGSDVKYLQEALVNNNFYPDIGASNNGVDGIYGSNTKDAVTRYQIMNGLTGDGIAGPNTLESLGLTEEGGDSIGNATNAVLRPGHSGEKVRRLQQVLVTHNFHPNINATNNGVDGIYGANTEDAVRRYQIMNGLTVDGIAGPETLSSLNISVDGVIDSGESVNILRPGESGNPVRLLQEALVDHNFHPNIDAPNNGVDGIYGPNTEDAVRRYQAMNGLTVDGIAGPNTLSSLDISENLSNGSSDGYSGIIRPGSSGDNVRLLQQALVNNNFYPNRKAANNGVDGVYGPNTEDAVRRYQTMNGLSADGIAGPETLSSLGFSDGGTKNSGSSGSYGETLRPGDLGDPVLLLQETLVDNNFYPNRNAANNGVDGVYGPNTEDAVRRYQTMNGLTADGIAGPETLSSLGLWGNSPGGSDENGGDEFIGGNLHNLSVSQVFIPVSNYNRPQYSMSPDYITIHETANTAPGATAFMHSNYVQNATTVASWHFTVDDGSVVFQHLPVNETGFHAGDGSGDGNRNSIGIELCVNDGGDFSQTRRNAVRLVSKLMREYNIPVDHVVPHNYWSGKNCPATLLSQFDGFREQVIESAFTNTYRWTNYDIQPGDIIGEPHFEGWDTRFVGHVGIVGDDLRVYEVVKLDDTSNRISSNYENFIDNFGAGSNVQVVRPAVSQSIRKDAGVYAATHNQYVENYRIDQNLDDVLDNNYCSKFVWQSYFRGAGHNLGDLDYDVNNYGTGNEVRVGYVTPQFVLNSGVELGVYDPVDF